MNGSTIAGIRRGNPFSTIEAFSGEFRCIYADLRHAAGQSTGPLEVNRPWDAYTDDHLGLMDHLGIDRFMVLGFCIAGPFIWNLIKRAPDRVVAAVPAQPVGFRPELPNAMYESQSNSWGAEVVKRHPDITTQMADQFLNRLFRTNPDFVFTVTRDFVRQCQTPVLVLPDDSAGHSYDAAIESAMLAPSGQLNMYLGRPQSSWTRIKGESDVTRRWGYGSVEAGEGSWVGADGGSPEGDRSRRRRGGDGVGGLGAGTTVEREPETGCGVAAAA